MKTITKKTVLSEIEQELIKREISKWNIEDIIEELQKQSFNVQATFYYRIVELNQSQIAEILNVSQVRVTQYLNSNLKNIKNILKKVL